MKEHKHDAGGTGGGDELNPKQIYMGEAEGADDEFRLGVGGIKMTTSMIQIGLDAGPYVKIHTTGFIEIKSTDGKFIYFGNQAAGGGSLGFVIDGNEY